MISNLSTLEIDGMELDKVDSTGRIVSSALRQKPSLSTAAIHDRVLDDERISVACKLFQLSAGACNGSPQLAVLMNIYSSTAQLRV